MITTANRLQQHNRFPSGPDRIHTSPLTCRHTANFHAAGFSIQDALAEVAGAIAPVWPLRDYVAVNPYAGISSQRFLDARRFLQSFSDCELLMPLEYYAAPFGEQLFSRTDIRSAIAELRTAGLSIFHTD